MTSRVLGNSHNTTLFLALWANYKTYRDQNTSYGRRRTWGRRWCFHIDGILRLFLARMWWTSDSGFAGRLNFRLARKMNYSGPKPLVENPRKKQEPYQIQRKWQQNSNPQIPIDILCSSNHGNSAIYSQEAELEMPLHFRTGSGVYSGIVLKAK